MNYPKSIQNLIDQFTKLPGIGPKTAERLVFYLLYQPQRELFQFGEAIEHLKNSAKQCQKCFNFAESDPCHICANSKRSSSQVCIVAKPQDIQAIEKTGAYQGLYHVLGGNINPIENHYPENLRIKELITKVQSGTVNEIILALNPDLPGETTSLYLIKTLKQYPQIKITRLARGLPMGADLEYADEITLDNAFKNRQLL